MNEISQSEKNDYHRISINILLKQWCSNLFARLNHLGVGSGVFKKILKFRAHPRPIKSQYFGVIPGNSNIWSSPGDPNVQTTLENCSLGLLRNLVLCKGHLWLPFLMATSGYGNVVPLPSHLPGIRQEISWAFITGLGYVSKDKGR